MFYNLKIVAPALVIAAYVCGDAAAPKQHVLDPCQLGAGQQETCNDSDKRVGPPSSGVESAENSLPVGVLARMGSVRMDIGADVASAAFTADGKSLSVAPWEERHKHLEFLDLTTGKSVRRLPLPRGVRQHVFTRDERFLIVRSFYYANDPKSPGAINFAEIHVLDGATGKPVWKTDPKIEFASMAISADGKLLAGGVEEEPGKGSDIYLWDTVTGKQRAILKGGHHTAVKSLSFSEDGKRLVSASPDVTPVAKTEAVEGNICVWDLADGKKVKDLSRSGFHHTVSPNGKTIAFYEDRRHSWNVLLWDLDADKKIAVLPVAGGGYGFSADGRTFVTGSEDDMLRLWDTTNGHEIRKFKGLVGNGVYPLAFSRDGTLLATCSSPSCGDSSIRLWDVKTGEERNLFRGHALDITCLSFSLDGSKLASGSLDQTVRVWETATGKQLMEFDKHEAAISSVAVSADGRTTASGDRANITYIWDTETGKQLHRTVSEPGDPGNRRAISILSFSPDGKTLWIGSKVITVKDGVSVRGKGEIIQLDTATGKQIRTARSENSVPLAISPDGELSVWTQHIKPSNRQEQAFGDWEEKVVVRKTETGKDLYEIANKDYANSRVSQVIFSPDSKLIALNSHWLAQSFYTSAIVPCYRLVEAANGKEVVNRIDADYPWTVFPADGKVVVGSYKTQKIIAPGGGMVRVDNPSITVLDAVTGKKSGQVPSYPMLSSAWAVSPKCKFFASVSHLRTILVWDIGKLDLK